MLAPGLFVWAKFVTCRTTRRSSKWSASNGTGAFASPAATASSAQSDMRLVTLDNPLGVDPEDPKSSDDVIIERPSCTSRWARA